LRPKAQKGKKMADHNKPVSHSEAMKTALDLVVELAETCHRITVAGSLRRKKNPVNDIEILLSPKTKAAIPRGSLLPETFCPTEEKILQLIKSGILAKRLKSNGTQTFGKKTKLLIHLPSGIPVDIFACQTHEWFNCLVCRTGGKDTNIKIAAQAKRRGLRWMPCGAGFLTAEGTLLPVHQEQDVFKIAGLPYKHPSQRQ
jgi:DNA polymerase/3'-5' exonuclease PolX